MKVGEVSLCTNDVVRLADFYKALLNINNDSNDDVHQFIISEETTLTIYNDGSVKNNNNQNMCLSFTVDDVDEEYERLLAMGVEVIDRPETRPWGARNMHFRAPDGNQIYFRSILKD